MRSICFSILILSLVAACGKSSDTKPTKATPTNNSAPAAKDNTTDNSASWTATQIQQLNFACLLSESNRQSDAASGSAFADLTPSQNGLICNCWSTRSAALYTPAQFINLSSSALNTALTNDSKFQTCITPANISASVLKQFLGN